METLCSLHNNRARKQGVGPIRHPLRVLVEEILIAEVVLMGVGFVTEIARSFLPAAFQERELAKLPHDH